MKIKWSSISLIMSSYFGKVTAFLSLVFTFSPLLEFIQYLNIGGLMNSLVLKILGSMFFLISYVLYILRCPSVIKEFSSREGFVASNSPKSDIALYFDICVEEGNFDGKLVESVEAIDVKSTYWRVVDRKRDLSKSIVVASLIFAFVLFYCKELIWIFTYIFSISY